MRGQRRIHLKKGDKIFPLWLADLDQAISRSSVKSGYQNIPSRLVNQISGQFTTAYQVKEQLDSIKEDVTKLKSFRLYVLVFLGLIGLAFFPTIRDNIVALFFATGSTRPLGCPTGASEGTAVTSDMVGAPIQ